MQPIICVPMGDPAGIGPEITAAAAVAPEISELARLVVVGQREILAKAASLMQVAPRIRPIKSCAEAEPGALNLIEAGELRLGDFSYGQVQANCGQAAFAYIIRAVELALAGEVDALASTPINKESLKAANIDYIGHTEILADLTGTPDPLTMFQVRDLRVFFLTRHMSLVQACKLVRRERLEDYIGRCLKELVRLGVAKPRLAVAGLNPHCGEHGLFGFEEVEQIEPAIAAARLAGLDAVGPVPADSVFHFALQGKYDAVLSLYHDQGHIATKTLDFERTISLTLGLPFLRTSVDHGTAFDIAGQGRAGSVSMVEAIRLAALYAPNFK